LLGISALPTSMLRAETPVDIMALTALEGVGPRWRSSSTTSQVRTLADLEQAARRQKGSPHSGEKTEQKNLKGSSCSGSAAAANRWRRSTSRATSKRLAAVPASPRPRSPGRCGAGGAIGDPTSRRRARRRAGHARLPAMPRPRTCTAAARPRRWCACTPAWTPTGVVPVESFGAAPHYFTGSKDHNVALRRIAIERGLKLNEYGVFDGERSLAGRTEADVYAALGLPYIPPELREMTGEIEAARAGTLPALIEAGSLRGDLQTQTDWTDGADSLADAAPRGCRGLDIASPITPAACR
jgi:DNA polymerase (family 10)